MWNIDGATKFLARVALAAFVGMMPIVAAPVAIASPHGILDDCVPVGVTTRPDGTVWAIENCHGVELHHILPQR